MSLISSFAKITSAVLVVAGLAAVTPASAATFSVGSHGYNAIYVGYFDHHHHHRHLTFCDIHPDVCYYRTHPHHRHHHHW